MATFQSSGEHDTPEYLTMVDSASLLVNAISLDPLEVAIKCFEKRMFSVRPVQEQTRDSCAKASELVTLVTTKVKDDPETFQVFMRILNELHYLQYAAKIVNERYECKKMNASERHHGKQVASCTVLWCDHLHFKIDAGTLFEVANTENLGQIKERFAFLVSQVTTKLSKKPINMTEFRIYFSTKFPGDYFSSTDTVYEIFDILNKKHLWNYLQYQHIEAVCKRFGQDDRGLEQLIKNYKIDLAGFKAATKICDYIQKCHDYKELAAQSQSLDITRYDDAYCNKLSLKIGSRITQKSLDYIDELWMSIANFYLVPSLPVLLESIHEGCVEIVWLIPPEVASKIECDIVDLKVHEFMKTHDVISMTLNAKVLYEKDIYEKMQAVQSRKPMSAKRSILQQGVEKNMLDYYDIMVIGKTGMGKSTTVDKMLIARLEGPPENNPASSQHQEPVYDESQCRLVCDDLTMWMVASNQVYDDYSFVKVSLRLKNLVFFRSLDNSHEEINQSRETNMKIYDSTLECELLSNEKTKIRILDVPGFFGRETSGDEDTVELRGGAVVSRGLSSMRKVLRIKNAYNLKFKRVVYFLPEKGVLQRTDQHLILELQIMEKHFGRAIFDSMVVIATESLGAYRHANPTSIMYTKEDFMKTKHHLQEALSIVFKGKDVPEPPIKFISLFDTCETILHKIQSAEVTQECVMLKFKHSFCTRCGLTIVEQGESNSESVYCTSPDRSRVIPLEQSTCHPVMIPKYSTLERVVGGVLHLVTLTKFMGKWPSFLTMDEVCINCKGPPKSHGCMLIGSKYEGANDDGTVRHSSSAVETYQVRVQEDDSQPIPIPASTPPPTFSPPGVDTSAVVGVGLGFPVSSLEPSLHIHSERQVFKQEKN